MSFPREGRILSARPDRVFRMPHLEQVQDRDECGWFKRGAQGPRRRYLHSLPISARFGIEDEIDRIDRANQVSAGDGRSWRTALWRRLWRHRHGGTLSEGAGDLFRRPDRTDRRRGPAGRHPVVPVGGRAVRVVRTQEDDRGVGRDVPRGDSSRLPDVERLRTALRGACPSRHERGLHERG